MTYQVILSPHAQRQFDALPRAIQERLTPRIDALAENPHPAGVSRIKGQRDLLRLRVGDYRVIYRVEEDRVRVLIVRVGHRREVYRGL